MAGKYFMEIVDSNFIFSINYLANPYAFIIAFLPKIIEINILEFHSKKKILKKKYQSIRTTVDKYESII